MEIPKFDDPDRLKDIAIKGAALVVGGAVVKYLWEQQTIKGYVYHIKESGTTFIGLLRGNDNIQFSGKLTERGKDYDFESDEITDEAAEAIDEIEQLINNATNKES